MSYRILFILLEGDDDKRFVDSVFIPRLEEKFQAVNVVKYAQLKNDKFVAYISSIRSMGAEYILMTDINGEPCVTKKKQKILQEYRSAELENITVVIRQIESWYLAGLNAETSKKLKINLASDPERITKQNFDDMIPRLFLNRTDFMVEILKCYSVDTAINKSNSFRYTCSRLGIT